MLNSYGRLVGKYWLSVITRRYDCSGQLYTGRESAIIEQDRGGKGLPKSGLIPFIQEGDYSREFDQLTTEAEVEAFITKQEGGE